MQRIPSLFIAPSPLGGRGVFTNGFIEEGSIIEICPVLVLPGKEKKLLDKSLLYNYYFMWGEDDEECALLLGYGSIYNHSYQPNAEYRPDFEEKMMRFYALVDIEAGAEIKVNYNGDPLNQEAVWFEVMT
ncbi:MAG: SET domain-containing protein [Saprospiraceae bacterium]